LGQYGDVIKISAKEILDYEHKQDKLWFDEECLKFVGKRRQVNWQRLQEPSHIARWSEQFIK
jgi:hypothetical protein